MPVGPALEYNPFEQDEQPEQLTNLERENLTRGLRQVGAGQPVSRIRTSTVGPALDYNPFEQDELSSRQQEIDAHEEQGGGIVSSLERGARRAKQTFAAAGASVGDLIAPEQPTGPIGQFLRDQVDRDIAEVKGHQTEIEKLPVHPTMGHVATAADKAPDLPSAFAEAGKAFWESPDKIGFAIEQLAEQVPVFAAFILGTKGAGNLVGIAKAGAETAAKKKAKQMAALGLGSGFASVSVTYGPNVSEGLIKGLSFDDAEARGLKQSFAQAMVDGTVGSLLPLKIGPGQYTNVPAQALLQAAGGGLGETAKQASVGESIKNSEIVLESALELLGLPVELVQAASTRKQSETAPAEAPPETTPVEVDEGADVDLLDPNKTQAEEIEAAPPPASPEYDALDPGLIQSEEATEEERDLALTDVQDITDTDEGLLAQDLANTRVEDLTGTDEGTLAQDLINTELGEVTQPETIVAQAAPDEPVSTEGIDYTELPQEQPITATEPVELPPTEGIEVEELNSPEQTEIQDVAKTDTNVATEATNVVKMDIKAARKETDTEKSAIFPPVGKATKLFSDSDTSDVQSVSNSVLADSKFFGDRFDAKSVEVKGFDSFNRKDQSMMLSQMVRLLNEKQVLRAVIKAVPVDVMNSLLRSKWSANDLLHDPSMLTHRLSMPGDIPIPKSVVGFVDSLASKVSSVSASLSAEKSSLLGSDRSSKRGTTVATGSKGGLDTGSTAEKISLARTNTSTESSKDFPASGASERDFHLKDNVGADKQKNKGSPKTKPPDPPNKAEQFSKSESPATAGFSTSGVEEIEITDVAQEDKAFTQFKKQTKTKHKLDNFDVTMDQRGAIELSRIDVPENTQGRGAGSAAMQDLVDYADKNKNRVWLSVAGVENDIPKARLKRFYKRFGFIENKGANKRTDLPVQAGMYRNPISKTQRPNKKTGLTVENAKEILTQRFGTKVISKLESDGILKIIEKQSDLPAYINDGGIIRGAVSKGKAYIVTENTTAKGAASNVEGVFLHEMGVHYGFKPMLGDQKYDAVMEQVRQMVRAQHPGMVRANENVMNDLDAIPEQFVNEERLAYFLQDSRNRTTSLYKKVMAAIRAFLFRVGFVKKLTPESMEALAVASIRRVTRGETKVFGEPVPVLQSAAKPTAAQAKANLKKAGMPKPGEGGKVALEQGEGTSESVVKEGELASKTEAKKNLEGAGFDKPLYSRTTRGTDSQEAAIEATIGHSKTERTFRQAFDGFLEKFRNTELTAVKQGMLDEFASIEKLEKDTTGKVQDASQSAYKSALRTKNLNSVMAAVMMRGPLVYRNGTFQLKEGAKGFSEIFEPLAEKGLLRLWEGWAAANRAQRLMKEGREHNFTQKQIDELLTLEAKYPEFRQVLNDYLLFNKGILDLAESVGLINGAERKTWARNDYVPFYRSMEELDGSSRAKGPFNKRGLSGQSSGIKTLKGGENKIGSVIENMIMNAAHLVDASFKNVAMQKTVALADGIAMEEVELGWKPEQVSNSTMAAALRKSGINVEKMGAEQRSNYQTVFNRAAPAGNDIVSVREGGKLKYYRVIDPLLLRSIASMGASSVDGIMTVLRGAKRLLTSTVTVAPGFMIANYVRDSLSTWVVSDAKMIPFFHSMKGMAKSWREDDALLSIMAGGGGGGGFYKTAPEDIRRQLDEKLKSINQKTLLDSPQKLWRFWQKVGAASENANRIAIYEAVLKEGGSKAEAIHQARDILDFTMRGDYAAIRFMTETVPFLNARLQGLYRLQRGYKENPKAFAIKGLLLTSATMALAYANWDNEEYDDLPEWDKDTYYHFWVEGQHYRLPKPFEVGAVFSTIPERMVEYIRKGDGELLGKRFGKMFLDTFAFNPIPQMFKPIMEQYSNRISFTDRPIVGKSLERLKPEAQYDPWTSETMRLLAETMPDAAPAWMRSPKRLEAALRGYTSTLGMYLLSISDDIVHGASNLPVRPDKGIGETNVIKRFVRNKTPRYTKHSSKFYEMLRESNELYSTIRRYRQEGRLEDAKELVAEGRPKLGARKTLNIIARNVSKINTRIKRIHLDTKLTAIQKRNNIDLLIRRKNALLKRASRYTAVF